MQNIIEHYRDPENYGLLAGDNVEVVSVHNPVCGDRLILSVLLDDGIVESVGFEGEGCSISQATMSMLSEELVGKVLKDLQRDLMKEMIVEMVGIDLSPTRLKCALLSLDAVKKVRLPKNGVRWKYLAGR